MEDIQFFSGIKDSEALKDRRKQLMLQHHPDRGGDQEIAKIINVQYGQAALRLAIQEGQQFAGSHDLSLVLRGYHEGFVNQHKPVTVAVVTDETRLWLTFATFEGLWWTEEVDDETLDDALDDRYFDPTRDAYFINRPLDFLVKSYHNRLRIYGN